MKKEFNISLCYFLMIGLFVTSCYKDDGNYDYDYLGDIVITDTENTETIHIAQNETLSLVPEIQLNGNTDDVSYLWFAYRNTQGVSYAQPYDTIAFTRDLNYSIDGNIFTLGESYRLTYKVTSNKTGVSAYHFYDLVISDVFTTGWMFLEDKAGYADLSMIRTDGTTIHNIYSDRNASHPLHNPLGITITKANVTDNLSDVGKRFYIWSETDGVEINYLTMEKKFDYNYLFFTPPSQIKPQWLGWSGYLSSSGSQATALGISINDGLLHTNYVGGFPGTKKWAEPLASPANGYDYELAPFLAPYYRYTTSVHPLVMYDNKNRRFYSVTYSTLSAFATSASNKDIFDMNDVGLDMFSMTPSYQEHYHDAVMKDDAGTPYLLRFKNTVPTSAPAMTISKQVIHAPNAASMSAVESSGTGGYLFYASGNTLYRYEYLSDSYTAPYTFGGGEEVTFIEFDKDARGTNLPTLMVATWNGSEGKVYYFDVSATNDLTYNTAYTGFGKIIGMAPKT